MLAVIKPSEFAVDFGAQTLIEGGCAVLTAQMERLQRRVRFLGARSEIVIRIGHPAAETLRMAREWQPDLIVTGQPQCSWFGQLVAAAAIRWLRARAPCDLIVATAAGPVR